MFFRSNKNRLIVNCGSKEKKPQTFFDLPAKEQKRIIKNAAKRANADQRELVEKADNLSLSQTQ